MGNLLTGVIDAIIQFFQDIFNFVVGWIIDVLTIVYTEISYWIAYTGSWIASNLVDFITYFNIDLSLPAGLIDLYSTFAYILPLNILILNIFAVLTAIVGIRLIRWTLAIIPTIGG